jgi:FMN phosphatase YigB (HAD superfamily)
VARTASFDVFDTALTRTIGGPRQVFVEAGRRLRRAGRTSIDAEAYAAAREQAGWSLTSDVGRHPSLHRIAEELADRLGLLPSMGAELMATELDVERDVCRAVPGFKQRAEQSRRETGRGIVFISDTPLPTDFLRDLLVREGVFCKDDQLYTSSALGASKQEGALFDVVAARLGVPPAQFVHVGDDSWADLAHGRMHGWNATLDTRARFTGREHDLDQQAVATDGLGPRLAGAARMSRLTAIADGIDPGLARIAGAVALPLLAGFGLWVLQQAELLKLDRLYFVARDGEIFRSVTQRLAQQADNEIECRYLYGSRLSWQLASERMKASDLADGLWPLDEGHPESLSARVVLARFQLSPEDARVLTAGMTLLDGRVDEPLGDRGWAELREVMTSDPLATEIARRAGNQRDLLVRYLDQEGVTAPGRVGLVDVGWTGRTARALEDVLLGAERPRPAAHLFLGLRGTAPAVMGPDLRERSHGWLLDEARGRGIAADGSDPVMIIESFSMGSEGHTVGYELADGNVVPRLAAQANPAASRWGFGQFRVALDSALSTLLDGSVLNATVDLRPLVGGQITSFWHHPSRVEAAAWGAQPYGEDFHNTGAHPLATPVTGRRVLASLGLGPDGWREPTYWRAGTIAVSRGPWRYLLTAMFRAERLGRRLPRIPVKIRGHLAMRRNTGS